MGVLVSVPATLIARPVQAADGLIAIGGEDRIAEKAGPSTGDIDGSCRNHLTTEWAAHMGVATARPAMIVRRWPVYPPSWLWPLEPPPSF
jgi:hypothetical protein